MGHRQTMQMCTLNRKPTWGAEGGRGGFAACAWIFHFRFTRVLFDFSCNGTFLSFHRIKAFAAAVTNSKSVIRQSPFRLRLLPPSPAPSPPCVAQSFLLKYHNGINICLNLWKKIFFFSKWKQTKGNKINRYEVNQGGPVVRRLRYVFLTHAR